ncbi:DEAD/DEAH box helicase [Corynebacterium variabile]|uniref:Helicase n=1 Tax=Corynebacterium variabile TaxID=1727 RepID=A0A4Y4C0Q7_9CORY|nr:DEAD/DEAH box helicase [Corynebacterium variabile]GEC86595.1 helicase [Corynebacterium variabile]
MTLPVSETPTAPENTVPSPGVTVTVRDEQWLVTGVARTTDGYRVRVRGVSDYVRDTTATFFTALDEIEVLDPTKVTVTPDSSPGYRRARLWVESTLRQTPVPMDQQELEVSTRMLADPLDYQLSAVHRALDPANVRPRILLADAVGLGKTLEIGMILAELIRRGRGERILVITPKHVMEQFQQELWTRFSIPLVRLDSVGIQKVRQKLPASRNPFTYFPRVIVSIDTLKSPKFRAQLRKVHWDAVVIDEIHNATNASTQNNELARTVAPRTDALILASATPHNGDDESFKEILRLLDPLSVLPDGSVDMKAAKRLIIRRHRHSPEVAKVVGGEWAPREKPRNILVEASREEDAVARELHDTWVSGANSLFTWTLVKTYLSSPAALTETISGRITRNGTSDPAETRNLERLLDLSEKITPETSEKYNALVNYLQEIGVGKGKETRAVVFSERVATLHWLQENLTTHLKMPAGAVKVMHGGLSDTEQMEIIDEFKRSDTPLRILVTGDVASEGVNLHLQCHHLVHYDIPWSLIRIQQRNGRIDRYGQHHNPQITTLLLDPSDAGSIGELHVLEKLVEREYTAHQLLGDAASLMGEHSEQREEEAIREVLRGNRDFDAVVHTAEDIVSGAHALVTEIEGDGPATTADMNGLFAALNALSGTDTEQTDGSDGQTTEPQTAETARPVYDQLPDTTYPSEIDYLRDALNEAFGDAPQNSPTAGGIDWVEHPGDLVELTPPEDLRRRFDFLPQDYVSSRKVKENLMLATSPASGKKQLDNARNDRDNSWPKAHFLGPLHPVSEWAADRALSAIPRNEIPAVTATVATPTVLLLGTLTNTYGQVVSRTFMAATEGPLGLSIGGSAAAAVEVIADPVTWLADTGLSTRAINDGSTHTPADTAELMAAAVAAAQATMNTVFTSAEDTAHRRTDRWTARYDAWSNNNQLSMTRTMGLSKQLVEQEQALMQSMTPARSLVRPLLVLLP